MTAGILYALLVVALVVRVRTSREAVPGAVVVGPGEPLRLVMVHHGLFYLLLAGSPLVAWWTGGVEEGRLVGGGLFALGVALYRRGGHALGAALSPLVGPRPGAALVTTDVYRLVRHPMYLGQALIAVGAPLLLGARPLLVLSLAALAVLGWRIVLEESALARTYPEFSRYAAGTRRIVPFLY